MNGENVRSEKRTIDFPIPEVIGYLGNLTFNKISSYGNVPLDGAIFELIHDRNCPCMKERKHIDENYSINSISNNGVVTFNNIPSGHKYKLHEIETDIYHDVDTTMYNVTVSYGVVVTDLKDNKVINKYKTRNLTILKEVLDVSSNKSFEFEIEATYRGKSLDGTYKILKNGIEGIIKFENGKCYVKLLGACTECDMADNTIKDMIEYTLKFEIPEIEEVINVI